jgi:CheY-like chemotaxis protein
MPKIVLLVDDDADMIESLKQGLERYQDTFSVVTAESGESALKVLHDKPVSLLITDLKMPGMDGFELLGHVMEYYPDVPVMIMTGYSTPEMKQMATKGGAVGYIAKPFLVENLAREIIVTLRRESDGGTLHGVSSGIFLQLIEMEERTCTIRLTGKGKGKKGALFFKEGELLDARLGNLQGVEAAYEIFSWEEVSLSIQNGCPRNARRIKKDLQAVLLEAMRRKDDDGRAAEVEAPDPETALIDTEPATSREDMGDTERIRNRIESALGDRAQLRDVYADETWNSSFARIDSMARALGAGGIKLAVLDKGKPFLQILLSTDPTIVVEVGSRCPKDKLMSLLDRPADGTGIDR